MLSCLAGTVFILMLDARNSWWADCAYFIHWKTEVQGDRVSCFRPHSNLALLDGAVD